MHNAEHKTCKTQEHILCMIMLTYGLRYLLRSMGGGTESYCNEMKIRKPLLGAGNPLYATISKAYAS